MPREDLALTIERQVVAIFAHQNMRQQARARHSLGDGALRRSGLVDRPAGAATIFGAPGAQNPQPCRHEVEHLTDGLAEIEQLARRWPRLSLRITDAPPASAVPA